MANALAYYDTAAITAIKSFIVKAPGIAKLSYVYVVLGSVSLTRDAL